MRGKILLFSYAFPPMQVQMTPAVFKPMAALAECGYEVDVVCADSFCKELPLDFSLSSKAEQTFSTIHRLRPPSDIRGMLVQTSRVLSRVPDLMSVLHRSAFDHLMSIDLQQYEAIMTWSPFHSINAVMTKVRSQRKGIRWIAQFCDPWAGNPLEVSKITKAWNWWHQPATVRMADAVVHTSAYSLELMLGANSEYRNKTSVVPHVFNRALFPDRPRKRNDKLTIRYVGVLYGKRTPEPLFEAISHMFDRRPELRQEICLEIVGAVPPEMLQSNAANSLPPGFLRRRASVSYIESLELMYDSDLLVLIDADVRQNLFLPSKLSDYVGADVPILGLVPPGASCDLLRDLNASHFRPSDVRGISAELEQLVDRIRSGDRAPNYSRPELSKLDASSVAASFGEIIQRVA
jgi:glycosyltransferase involved in cell wall biosynthesis